MPLFWTAENSLFSLPVIPLLLLYFFQLDLVFFDYFRKFISSGGKLSPIISAIIVLNLKITYGNKPKGKLMKSCHYVSIFICVDSKQQLIYLFIFTYANTFLFHFFPFYKFFITWAEKSTAFFLNLNLSKNCH